MSQRKETVVGNDYRGAWRETELQVSVFLSGRYIEFQVQCGSNECVLRRNCNALLKWIHVRVKQRRTFTNADTSDDLWINSQFYTSIAELDRIIKREADGLGLEGIVTDCQLFDRLNIPQGHQYFLGTFQVPGKERPD